MKFIAKGLFIYFLAVGQNAFAVTLINLNIDLGEPLIVYVPQIEPIPPKLFQPKSIANNFYLEINPDKSYFYVEEGTVVRINQEAFMGSSESIEYAISGQLTLSDRYFEDQYQKLEETKLTSITVQSDFENIDISSSDFWNENYTLKYLLESKAPDNLFCACAVTDQFSTVSMEGSFDGAHLELNGRGLFSQYTDGKFYLEPSMLLATHTISYHIDASVVSSVPVPPAFYLFFSGVAGLIFSRFSSHQ